MTSHRMTDTTNLLPDVALLRATDVVPTIQNTSLTQAAGPRHLTVSLRPEPLQFLDHRETYVPLVGRRDHACRITLKEFDSQLAALH